MAAREARRAGKKVTSLDELATEGVAAPFLFRLRVRTHR
jgi:hypothetical protein